MIGFILLVGIILNGISFSIFVVKCFNNGEYIKALLTFFTGLLGIVLIVYALSIISENDKNRKYELIQEPVYREVSFKKD